jgi:hypothetical protein
MAYYIDIIDTLSPLTQLVLKSASAKGIVLEWSGSDAKDGQTIVGSNLKFDMLTVNDDDAFEKYIFYESKPSICDGFVHSTRV